MSAWWLTYNSGFTHPYFDKPPGSRFEVEDLRARIVLSGCGVQALQFDDVRFELVAGDWRAVLHQSPAAFHGAAASWEIGGSDDAAWVDVVLHCGPRHTIDFHTANLHLGWGLELLHRSAEPSAEPVIVTDGPQFVRWQWEDLDVAVPTAPTPFDAPLGESAHE